MMIFWRKSLVMFSVPRTGTHSYIDHLHPHADMVFRHPTTIKHMGLRRFTKKILPLLPENREGLDHFGFVRHPADWLWSWYRYRSRPEIAGRPGSTADIGFATFLREHLSAAPPPRADVGRQSIMLTSPEPPFRANILYRHENRSAADAFLCERLGARVAPPQDLNRSPRRENQVTPADIRLLERELPREFELYEAAS
ncbi:hypothetical protein Q4511_02705 [Paracoccus sp. 1_MG-2023]|uniref:hypothetical protein n=1 Tax=unclassified Paracoccus (in: a-proteobacteria) TaxID=2688777 RepID=UPI001C09DC96|nr:MULTISPECIES: hypothetical protein [unclassified Paracoccus (in: a-proteobacteria)]MBU2956145.1 hypothetical protein [Paracoccus sp. C2R09]MDO6667821.1 hypothetical protein [Paracoccus sp. 1_MG-2023]